MVNGEVLSFIVLQFHDFYFFHPERSGYLDGCYKLFSFATLIPIWIMMIIQEIVQENYVKYLGENLEKWRVSGSSQIVMITGEKLRNYFTSTNSMTTTTPAKL